MSKIKFTGPTSIGGHRYEKDDVGTLSDADAKVVCENGWGEDLDGKFPTGELNINPKKLEVRPSKAAQPVKKA